MTGTKSVLVIACGALAREIQALKRLNGWRHLTISCLPAELHNRPTQIAGRLRQRIVKLRDQHSDIFVAYADCGSYGAVDRVLDEFGLQRLPGDHCYATFAGQAGFAELAQASPATFYLTDFLVRHFDRLIIRGLQLDQHPELLSEFFGNYERALYLSQTPDPVLLAAARRAAAALGLRLEHQFTGYGELQLALKVRLEAA